MRGETTQGHQPNWEPLLAAVGEEVTGHFMWMFEVELTDGRRAQAYKHIDTRNYVHLSSDGTAFIYEPEDRYRIVPLADLLEIVFRPMIGLAAVTADQVEASWAAIERVRQREEAGKEA